MPKVSLYKMDGTEAGQIELSDAVFGAEVNKRLCTRLWWRSWLHGVRARTAP